MMEVTSHGLNAEHLIRKHRSRNARPRFLQSHCRIMFLRRFLCTGNRFVKSLHRQLQLFSASIRNRLQLLRQFVYLPPKNRRPRRFFLSAPTFSSCSWRRPLRRGNRRRERRRCTKRRLWRPSSPTLLTRRCSFVSSSSLVGAVLVDVAIVVVAILTVSAMPATEAKGASTSSSSTCSLRRRILVRGVLRVELRSTLGTAVIVVNTKMQILGSRNDRRAETIFRRCRHTCEGREPPAF